MSSLSSDLMYSLCTDITQIVREETGLHERIAYPIAAGIARRMQERWGGSEVYIPARSAEDRHREIREAMESPGATVASVGRALGVSRATVYNALSRGRGKS